MWGHNPILTSKLYVLLNIFISYTPWYTHSNNKLRLDYNNARSYMRHYQDVKTNYNTLAADIIFHSWNKACLKWHDITLFYSELHCTSFGSRLYNKTIPWSDCIHTQKYHSSQCNKVSWAKHRGHKSCCKQRKVDLYNHSYV